MNRKLVLATYPLANLHQPRDAALLPSDLLLTVDPDLKDIADTFIKIVIGESEQRNTTEEFFCLIDPNWIKQFRANRSKITTAGGDLDGWVKNEVARLEVFHGKRGFVTRPPMLKFLANPKSAASYIERLDEAAEQEKLGPVLSLLTHEDLLTSLTKSHCQNDARFVIGHMILSTFIQNDYSLDQYKQVADREGFAREKMFYLTDQVFCYVGMKLLQEYKSLPRAFLAAAEKFGQQEANSIFAGANVKTQFVRAFDVFKIRYEPPDASGGSNSRTKTIASSGPESAGQSSASRDKMVDPEKLH